MVLGIGCDLLDRTQVERLFDRVASEYGQAVAHRGLTGRTQDRCGHGRSTWALLAE